MVYCINPPPSLPIYSPFHLVSLPRFLSLPTCPARSIDEETHDTWVVLVDNKRLMEASSINTPPRPPLDPSPVLHCSWVWLSTMALAGHPWAQRCCGYHLYLDGCSVEGYKRFKAVGVENGIGTSCSTCTFGTSAVNVGSYTQHTTTILGRRSMIRNLILNALTPIPVDLNYITLVSDHKFSIACTNVIYTFIGFTICLAHSKLTTHPPRNRQAGHRWRHIRS